MTWLQERKQTHLTRVEGSEKATCKRGLTFFHKLHLGSLDIEYPVGFDKCVKVSIYLSTVL